MKFKLLFSYILVVLLLISPIVAPLVFAQATINISLSPTTIYNDTRLQVSINGCVSSSDVYWWNIQETWGNDADRQEAIRNIKAGIFEWDGFDALENAENSRENLITDAQGGNGTATFITSQNFESDSGTQADPDDPPDPYIMAAICSTGGYGSREFSVYENRLGGPTNRSLTLSVNPNPIQAGSRTAITASGCQPGEEVRFYWWRHEEIDVSCLVDEAEKGTIDRDSCGNGDSSTDAGTITANNSLSATFSKGGATQGNGVHDPEAFTANEDGSPNEYAFVAICNTGFAYEQFTVAGSCPVCPEGSTYDENTNSCSSGEVTSEICSESESACTPGVGCENAAASPTPSPTPPAPPCANSISLVGRCMAVTTSLGVISVDPEAFITDILGILLSISGGIAVLLIVYSGYKYMTSRGNPDALQAAKDRLVSAIVGLLFIIFSLVILQVIGVDILRLPGFGN